MRILLTNDDGILAPGLATLYEAVADLGEVHVVAPQTTQSASGHAISVLTPMLVDRVHVNQLFHGWSVDGRPADCVKLALLELLPERPDFVFSGINAGSNTAINVLYSGTVAAAVEAAFFGVPSLALSLELSHELDFRRAGAVARAVIEEFIATHPPLGTCLNVNIPALDVGWPRGTRVCPMGTAPMADHYMKRTDELGRSVYWLDGRHPDGDQNPESDIVALRERYVTITPLRFDMTHFDLMPHIRDRVWPVEYPRSPRE